MLTTLLVVLAGAAVVAVVVLERIHRQNLRAIARSSVRLRIGHVLAEELVAGEPLSDVLRMLVPDYADWCVLHLVEEGRIRRAVVVHVDPEMERSHQSKPSDGPPRHRGTEQKERKVVPPSPPGGWGDSQGSSSLCLCASVAVFLFGLTVSSFS